MDTNSWNKLPQKPREAEGLREHVRKNQKRRFRLAKQGWQREPKGPLLLLKYFWHKDVSYVCGINLTYLCFQLYEKNHYIFLKISVWFYTSFGNTIWSWDSYTVVQFASPQRIKETHEIDIILLNELNYHVYIKDSHSIYCSTILIWIKSTKQFSIEMKRGLWDDLMILVKFLVHRVFIK